MTPEQAANGRRAIELMTAWAADPRTEREMVSDRLTELLRDDPDSYESAVRLIYGFVNVTGLLLVQRYDEHGTREEETLRELGLRFADRN